MAGAGAAAGDGRGGRCRSGRRRSGRRGGRCRRAAVLVDVVEHVLARDASPGAGAGDRRGVEPVLGDETSHDRRQQLARSVGRGPVGRRGGSRSSGRGGWRGRSCRGGSRGLLNGPGIARGGRLGRGRLGRGRLGRGRLGRGRLGRCRLGDGSRCGWGSRSFLRYHREHGPDFDGVALGDLDLGEVAGHRCGHLSVDLLGRDLEERLVSGHGVADLLEPLRDRAFGDRLTELGHRDVGH